jgi:hypothetical protein
LYISQLAVAVGGVGALALAAVMFVHAGWFAPSVSWFGSPAIASGSRFTPASAEARARELATDQINRSRAKDAGGAMSTEAAFRGEVDAAKLEVAESKYFAPGETRIEAPSGSVLDGVKDPSAGTWLFILQSDGPGPAVTIEEIFEDGTGRHLSSSLSESP